MASGLGSSRVIFTLVYVIVRSVLGLLVVLFRRDLSKDAELLVLRTSFESQATNAAGSGYESQPTGTSQRYDPGSLPSRPGPQRLPTIR
jgi:hypothetical protein